MKHVSGGCFRGIYNEGLWEDDLNASALHTVDIGFMVNVVIGSRTVPIYFYQKETIQT